jgi:hypothetical protein
MNISKKVLFTGFFTKLGKLKSCNKCIKAHVQIKSNFSFSRLLYFLLFLLPKRDLQQKYSPNAHLTFKT